jgi:replicative DNA helicase|tara:strand:+ start:5311 stop:6696 length:1386 start_codon:yes stop_codon:yes gene_type:complete
VADTQENGFESFGKPYQSKVVQAIVTDNEFAEQIIEVLDVNFFDQKYLYIVAKYHFSYYNKYNSFPSEQILQTIIYNDLQEGDDLILKEQIKDFFINIKKNPLNGDKKYVKESSLEFCKKQSLKTALLKSVELINQSQYDQVVGMIKHSIELGTPKNYGHDYKEDLEKRHSEAAARNTITTGWSLLDKRKVLNGGLARGELGSVMGVAGSGKSMFLVHLGAHALKDGYNVVHYSLELSEANIGIRYDACLTGVSQNDAYKLKDAIKSLIPTLQNGSLFIKEFPTKSASVQTIRNHLRMLEAKDFKPDLVIVDYADIMRSTKGYDAKRFEIESIYEELRALSQEMNFVCWTASQTNRSAMNNDIIDLDMIGESWAKVQIADVVLTFSRKREDKLSKKGKVYIAKNRIGMDGLIFNAKIDTETVSIELHDYHEDDADQDAADDEKQFKRTLQEKWEDLKRTVN